jgi:hypothetical protein
MNVTELHIITVTGMKKHAEDRRDSSFQLAEQIKHEGEMAAYERVLRYLNNQNDLEKTHGVSLAESLVKLQGK